MTPLFNLNFFFEDPEQYRVKETQTLQKYLALIPCCLQFTVALLDTQGNILTTPRTYGLVIQ